MTDMKSKVIEEIKKIYDPEIPVNIYELGLIYKIEVDGKNKVNVDMTLTSPNCPVAESLPKEVKNNIMKIEGVSDVNLNLVWEPPWDKVQDTLVEPYLPNHKIGIVHFAGKNNDEIRNNKNYISKIKTVDGDIIDKKLRFNN